ncbi:MAG: class I SAM-dependent methyltransferase [Clostridiales bacterium]|jgi:tRNA (adenine22-N1)-methyltransferase|nr:class I SAM-dependent methyltransferase [Clostridiales bacterium]
MELSQRLKTIAAQVRHRTVADIGTDHGYIPVYLVESGRIDKAAACDIKKGPWSRAKETIDRHGLADRIDLRLGGGLSCVAPGEFETCVIAGMGGMLIIDILKESIDCAHAFRQIVLQPQLDVPDIRKFLHTEGFKIDKEEMVLEEHKYYNILSCSPGADEKYSEKETLFGKILLEQKDAVLKSSILRKVQQIEEILARMVCAENKNAAAFERINALTRDAENYREVLRCL